jgi:hypothetical protein
LRDQPFSGLELGKELRVIGRELLGSARGALGQTIGIPTGDVSTLNFPLSKQEKEFLYESGRKSAEAFFAGKPTARDIFGATPPASTLPK